MDYMNLYTSHFPRRRVSGVCQQQSSRADRIGVGPAALLAGWRYDALTTWQQPNSDSAATQQHPIAR